MSEAFIKKNVKLSLEFDGYLAKHPDLFKDIPNGAYIVITVSGDDKFNADSISIVKNMKRKKLVEAHKTSSSWSLKPLTFQTV
jgi:hypothetical protein